MNRTLRTLIVYGLSIIMLAILAQWWFDQVQGPEVVELSQFMDNVQDGGSVLRRLTTELAGPHVRALEVKVAESPGQGSSCRLVLR